MEILITYLEFYRNAGFLILSTVLYHIKIMVTASLPCQIILMTEGVYNEYDFGYKEE